MKIDKNELIEMFGSGVLQEISKNNLGGRSAIYAKGGEPIGVVSEYFEFKPPEQMIEVLQNTDKRQNAIKAGKLNA